VEHAGETDGAVRQVPADKITGAASQMATSKSLTVVILQYPSSDRCLALQVSAVFVLQAQQDQPLTV
jgi:hypothetical protein